MQLALLLEARHLRLDPAGGFFCLNRVSWFILTRSEVTRLLCFRRLVGREPGYLKLLSLSLIFSTEDVRGAAVGTRGKKVQKVLMEQAGNWPRRPSVVFCWLKASSQSTCIPMGVGIAFYWEGLQSQNAKWGGCQWEDANGKSGKLGAFWT